MKRRGPLYYAIPTILGIIIGVSLYYSSAAALPSIEPVSYITDIIKVRLYDKLFVREFLVQNPSDIMQLYTNFLYDYRVCLFRHGFFDDLLGWCELENSRLVNYDTTFLSKNRFAVKELVITHIESLYPQPSGYFYRTFLLTGFEVATGTPFKLGVHDGEVWGIFLLDDTGDWKLYTGRNPFIDGLSFQRTAISGGKYRIIDLIYYTQLIEDYMGPMAVDDRIRVFSLRCDELELTPPNPTVVYPSNPPVFPTKP